MEKPARRAIIEKIRNDKGPNRMKKHTDPNARLGGELMSASVVERLAAELNTGCYAGQDRPPAQV